MYKPDELFERLNRYHPNIKFTVEEDPHYFWTRPLCITPRMMSLRAMCKTKDLERCRLLEIGDTIKVEMKLY